MTVLLLYSTDCKTPKFQSPSAQDKIDIQSPEWSKMIGVYNINNNKSSTPKLLPSISEKPVKLERKRQLCSSVSAEDCDRLSSFLIFFKRTLLIWVFAAITVCFLIYHADTSKQIICSIYPSSCEVFGLHSIDYVDQESEDLLAKVESIAAPLNEATDNNIYLLFSKVQVNKNVSLITDPQVRNKNLMVAKPERRPKKLKDILKSVLTPMKLAINIPRNIFISTWRTFKKALAESEHAF